MKQQKQDVIQESRGNRQIINAQLDLLIENARSHIQDEKILSGLTKTKDELTRIVMSYAVGREEIRDNKDLTFEARSRKIKELAELTIKKIDALPDHSRLLAQLEARLYSTGPEKGATQQVLDFLKQKRSSGPL